MRPSLTIKRIVVSIALLFSIFFAYAQSTGPQLANITRPSPTQQAFQKYGDIPVSPYTGIPNISIPLYTVSFRDISVPITLSYHASGIKVAEEASQVGLGWVINAGGSISRNIIGDDDLNGAVYYNSSAPSLADTIGPISLNSYGCTLTLYDNSRDAASTIIPNYDLSGYLTTNPPVDFQPDQYYYNLPGESGKFVMKRNGQAVLLKQEKLLITMTAGDGTSWEITTLDGTRYEFTQYETYQDGQGGGLTTHISAWYLTKITSPAGNTVTFKYSINQSQFIVPQGSYSETRDDFDVPLSWSSPNYQLNGIYAPEPLPNQKGETPGKNYSKVTLDTIDFNTGIVTFNYSYYRPDLPGDQRLDSLCVFSRNSAGVLDPVPLRTVALSYDQFRYGDVDDLVNANPGSDSAFSNRMKLTRVQQKGYFGGTPVNEPPYVFTYYEGSEYTTLPSKWSFARDHWGYSNGQTGNTTLIPTVLPVNSPDLITAELGLSGVEREPDSNYMAAFSLEAIQYPTGGTTTFEYEANDFDEPNSEVNDFSFFSRVPDVQEQTQEMIYDAVLQQYHGTDTLDLTNESSYSLNPLVPGSSATVTINCAFRFSDATDCNLNINQSGLMYFQLSDTVGNVLSRVDPSQIGVCSGGNTSNCVLCNNGVFSYSYSMNLPPGKYIWQAYVTGQSTSYTSQLQDIHAIYTFYGNQSTNPVYGAVNGAYYQVGGGLRIHRITDHDPLNPSSDKIRRYVYHYTDDSASIFTESGYVNGTPIERSFGRRMSKPEYAYFPATVEQNQIVLNGTTVGNAVYPGFHLVRTSESNIPLNGSALGAVVGYDQVTELQGENGENGKTVYQYHNQPDHVTSYNDLIPAAVVGGYLPDRPPYASNEPDPLNGSLLKQTDYANVNGNFVPVRSETNTYTQVTGNQQNKVWGLESRFPTIHVLNDGGFESTSQGSACDRYLFAYISLQSDWIYQASTDQKMYNPNDSTKYVESFTQYYYDDTAHLLPTRAVTTNSKGETVTTTTHYPLDFAGATGSDAITSGVRNLQNVHVVNAPIEKYVQKVNSSGTNIGTTNATLHSYKVNNPLPNFIYEAKLAGPSTSFTPANVSSNSIAIDGSYEQRIAIDAYDSFGNVLQQHKVGDLNHAYIWDYGKTLPVCEVVNADTGSIAYTSFEADGTGHWIIGSGTIDATTSLTGSNSYNMSGSISRSGLNSGNTYIVSYWTTNKSPLSIAGTISGYPIQGKTEFINNSNWTLFVHKVTGQSTVTLNGSGHIDELRLYPANARMTTYNFTPLVGMTSQTDVGNRVTYYQYDGLSRLKRIRDQDYNILKTFDYQYQIPAGCGTGCSVLAMQTFIGTNTPGYPVGVFDVHGNLLGNATSASSYVSLWNNDTADTRIGTLAAGSDPLHFNLSVNSGQTALVSVTGCRYYQYDLPWNKLDGVTLANGTYVDFGDGTGMHLPRTDSIGDTTQYQLAPNTTRLGFFNQYDGTYWFIHTYPDTSLKTVTLYHNEVASYVGLDNGTNPATSLTKVRNLRGNWPQSVQQIGGSCYQQASALTIANISNWSSIGSVTGFWAHSGDHVTPSLNLNYAQDFMANNRNLQTINTTNLNLYQSGYWDSAFKINRLKSDWNTYFTNLQDVEICDAHWNREDLTALTHLSTFCLLPDNQNHCNDATNNPNIPIPSSVLDNVIIQIAAGAGQNVSNGVIWMLSGGSGGRTSASNAAVQLLDSKGWQIYIDNVQQ